MLGNHSLVVVVFEEFEIGIPVQVSNHLPLSLHVCVDEVQHVYHLFAALINDRVSYIVCYVPYYLGRYLEVVRPKLYVILQMRLRLNYSTYCFWVLVIKVKHLVNFIDQDSFVLRQLSP